MVRRCVLNVTPKFVRLLQLSLRGLELFAAVLAFSVIPTRPPTFDKYCGNRNFSAFNFVVANGIFVAAWASLWFLVVHVPGFRANKFVSALKVPQQVPAQYQNWEFAQVFVDLLFVCFSMAAALSSAVELNAKCRYSAADAPTKSVYDFYSEPDGVGDRLGFGSCLCFFLWFELSVSARLSWREYNQVIRTQATKEQTEKGGSGENDGEEKADENDDPKQTRNVLIRQKLEKKGFAYGSDEYTQEFQKIQKKYESRTGWYDKTTRLFRLRCIEGFCGVVAFSVVPDKPNTFDSYCGNRSWSSFDFIVTVGIWSWMWVTVWFVFKFVPEIRQLECCNSGKLCAKAGLVHASVLMDGWLCFCALVAGVAASVEIDMPCSHVALALDTS